MQDLLASRLTSHGFDSFRFSDAEEVVEHFGCLQWQDIGQALWVIGSRIEWSTEADIRKACVQWKIIRTWPMRGTLHYMDPKYVHMMLDLCAKKTLTGFAKRREFLGISDAHAERAMEIMERELRGSKSLTRRELSNTLETGGIPMQTQWMYHLACYAATRGLICFGPPTAKEETFVLLDEWVEKWPTRNREEELAELARIYFRGHGGATLDDLAWWCGLGKTLCKEAVSLIEKELEKVEYEGKIYYHFPCTPHHLDGSTRLIWGFDEYFLGYKDRSPIADIAHHGKLFTSNGIFFPIILEWWRAIGSWKREFKKDKVIFKIEILPWYEVDTKSLEQECERYARFSGYEKYDIVLR